MRSRSTFDRMVRVSLLVTLCILVVLDVLRMLVMAASGFFVHVIAEPTWPNIGLLLIQLPTLAALACTVVGLLRLPQHAGPGLPAVFNYPLQWHFAAVVLGMFVTVLRVPLPKEQLSAGPLWLWLLPAVTYATLCILQFARHPLRVASEARRSATKQARLLGAGIDLLHVPVLLTPHFALVLETGWRWPWLAPPQGFPWLVLLLGLVYWGTQELVFGRTLGKLFTGAFVVCQRGRFIPIVVRTAARLIPFEAFSFLGKAPGWHDRLSGTTVETCVPVASQRSAAS